MQDPHAWLLLDQLPASLCARMQIDAVAEGALWLWALVTSQRGSEYGCDTLSVVLTPTLQGQADRNIRNSLQIRPLRRKGHCVRKQLLRRRIMICCCAYGGRQNEEGEGGAHRGWQS